MAVILFRRNTARRLVPAGFFLTSLLLIGGLLLSFPWDGDCPPLQADRASPPRLASILKSAGDYCEKVKPAALNYVCLEKVTDKEYFFRYKKGVSGMMREEHFFDVRKVSVKTYLCDYQLIKNGVEFAERRTLLMDNGRKRNVPDSGLKNVGNSSQFLVYGPVGFLSRYWQQHFRYSILREDVVDGLPAVVIQAVPAEEREDNFQVGRVWVGPDSQVLRLELEPASLKDYEDEVLESPAGEFHKKMVWTIDYSVEKNGVRFPGLQRIQTYFVRENIDGVQQQALKRETLFEYVEYKFFRVDTEVRF
jgi:hypothetical protein